MADSQHKYLIERGWSQQQIDEVIRKAHEWLRGAGYTPLTEQGHWNGIMGSTQSYHLPSREKDARGMTEAFVEMLKGGKILDASRVHKFSRPGAKDMMARTAEEYAEDIATTAEIVRGWAKQMFEDAVARRYRKVRDTAQKIGQTMTRFDAELAKPIIASRPGAKDTMATRKPKVREKWETVFYEYFHGVPVSIMDSGKIKNDINAILASGSDLKVEMPKLVKKYGRFSRPGAKATFKVEDRFYFGKGRKERFADDAKQIAQTILAQLGGGRFVAMTGAKNLAFYNNPPGLRMSIGRGAKDAIKYLRVDYDRGSDTYTMIFSNKSGSTVKSVNHVYADSLQRVFTSTTGFDTHL